MSIISKKFKISYENKKYYIIGRNKQEALRQFLLFLSSENKEELVKMINISKIDISMTRIHGYNLKKDYTSISLNK